MRLWLNGNKQQSLLLSNHNLWCENAHTIFGPDIAAVRGKTVRHKPDYFMIDYIDIPMEFLKLHKYLALVVDVIFVKNLICDYLVLQYHTHKCWTCTNIYF